MGNLPALACAILACALHLAAGFARTPRKAAARA
jgi:CspA family cold shock protein